MITQHLGFDFGEDEYKVMGLASYGRPTMDLSWLLRPGDGAYSLTPDILRRRARASRRSPRRSGSTAPSSTRAWASPGTSTSRLQPFHSDLAASAQQQLETTVLVPGHAIRGPLRARATLCLAGGVAMNCVMNQKLAESGEFDAVYVPPVAGDAGLALGAALLLAPHA